MSFNKCGSKGIYSEEEFHRQVKVGDRFWTFDFLTDCGPTNIRGACTVTAFLRASEERYGHGAPSKVQYQIGDSSLPHENYIADLCNDAHGVFLRRCFAEKHFKDWKRATRKDPQIKRELREARASLEEDMKFPLEDMDEDDYWDDPRNDTQKVPGHYPYNY